MSTPQHSLAYPARPAQKSYIVTKSLAVSLCFVIIFAVLGCSKPTDNLADLSILNAPTEKSTFLETNNQEFDLGPTLSHGQTLRHEFTLTNGTNQPVRLMSSMAQTPCCSTIGPLPDSVPPHGVVKIPVVFRPGFATGFKRVVFTAETDRDNSRVCLFALSANLFSELEVISDEGIRSYPAGVGGKQTFHVVC